VWLVDGPLLTLLGQRRFPVIELIFPPLTTSAFFRRFESVLRTAGPPSSVFFSPRFLSGGKEPFSDFSGIPFKLVFGFPLSAFSAHLSLLVLALRPPEQGTTELVTCPHPVGPFFVFFHP